MKRLRQSSLEDCMLSNYLGVDKDNEGNTIPKYSKQIAIKAEIWPASSKLQAEMYGLRIVNIQNMLYQGKENININDRIYYDNDTYKVISASGKHIRILEIEKVLE